MNDNIQNPDKFKVELDNMTDIVEIDQRIKANEAQLFQKKTEGWLPLILSIGIVIYMALKISLSEVYLIITGFGLLYLGFNIWRVYRAKQQKNEIEIRLNFYRKKKSELLSSQTVKE